MKNVFRMFIVTSLAFFLVEVHAEMPKKERKALKQYAAGKLYARIDMPCNTGRHAWGTYKSPLVEVTPDGTNTDGDMSMSASLWHAQSTFWGVGPNDTLQVSDMSFDEGDIEIELEGIGNTDGIDTVILFKNINSMDDFQKAFDRAFSKNPLQDDYPDWPEDMRKAVGERYLLEGMNKRMAFYVVGSPEKFEKSEEAGKSIEVWYTRQERGTQMGYWHSSTQITGFPKELRFEDGELVSWSGTTAKGSDLDLDE